MRKTSLAIGAILCVAAAASAQSLSTWSKYKSITVNTKASGANVANTVANFPVLVRLDNTNASDVFTGALAGGADIRFTNAAGVPRPFQLETWDAVGKTATFWVLADSIKGNDSTASLRIYWGKAGVTSASNGAAVFDTTTTGAAFRAVYHMNGGSGAATELDATALANNLAASDSVTAAIPTDTVGAIGRARTFKGDTTTVEGRQYFVAPGTRAKPELNWGTSQPHTVSAWVYARSYTDRPGHGNSIINKGDNEYALQVYGGSGTAGTGAPAANKRWESAIYTSTWRQSDSKATNPATTGSWHFILGTWSGGANNTNDTGNIYVDGVLDSTIITGIGNPRQRPSWNLFVGANPNGGGLNSTDSATTGGDTRSMLKGAPTRPGQARYWDGHLDEIRLAQTARSADWAKLEFETQKPAAAVVILGASLTPPPPDTVKNVYYMIPGTGNNPRDTIMLTAGVAANLPLHFTGGPIDSVKITQGTLPAGLTVDKNTGALTGIPTAVTAAASQTLTIYTTGAGNTTRGLRTSVLPGPTANLDYAQDSVVYVAGLAVTNAPTWTGRNPTSFTITPALPAGLALNATTGVIAGTPTAASALGSYVVKGANATDTVTATVKITVVAGAGSETYSTWSQHRTIWLNTQSNGANVAGKVGKFPVLIRLDSASFGAGFAQAQTDGSDIRFTKADNTTRLPHQIERWDAAAKRAEVWVLVDSIKGKTIDSLNMHWGKAGAVNLSNGPSVFDTANGFQAVWHMNGVTGNETDATINGFLATANAAPTSGTGAVGLARTLDGTSQFFRVVGSAYSSLSFSVLNSYTLSAWANPTVIATNNNGHKLIEKGDNQWTLAVYNGSNPKYWEITTKINTGSSTWMQNTSENAGIAADTMTGKWTHVLGTFTGAPNPTGSVSENLFINGASVATRTETLADTSGGGRDVTVDVHIGVQSGAAPSGTYTRYWNGLLDELRIENRARSADWAMLEYANQRPAGQTLVAFTRPPIVSVKGALGASTAGTAFSVTSAGQGLVFRLQGAEGRATLSMIDVWGRTVWNGEFANGTLSWDGRATSGSSVAPGLYLARVSVRDAQGKVTQVLNRKIPLTR